ncbi:WAP-type 'four-disulfide core [Trichuris suis]|nr:WAP-type 'four-disulfide core [Trichuris suis]
MLSVVVVIVVPNTEPVKSIDRVKEKGYAVHIVRILKRKMFAECPLTVLPCNEEDSSRAAMNAIHVYLSFTLLWCVTFAHNSYHKSCLTGKRHSQEKWKNKLEEEHPGSCPDMQLEKPLTSNNDKCTSDKQCKITQKCCPTAIGKMCMETKDASNEQKPNEIKHTKPGECPALTKVEPKRRSEYRVKSCTHDKDCPGHKLCCQTNIGPLCMLPAKSNPDSSMSSGMLLICTY